MCPLFRRHYVLQTCFIRLFVRFEPPCRLGRTFCPIVRKSPAKQRWSRRHWRQIVRNFSNKTGLTHLIEPARRLGVATARQSATIIDAGHLTEADFLPRKRPSAIRRVLL